MKRNHHKSQQNTDARTRQIAVDAETHREFSEACKRHGFSIGGRASIALRKDLKSLEKAEVGE